MFNFFSYFFFLLIPILLILIVRLKRRRRVIYSHTFLRSFEDEKLLDFLLRTFQIYHDVLFDLILALVLAVFLAQIVRFTPNRSAICIDGSYSMLQGVFSGNDRGSEQGKAPAVSPGLGHTAREDEGFSAQRA
jgi:ABC-type spermidine/putrescine transport system permease subunit II